MSFYGGPVVNILGQPETAHVFNPGTGDILQRVTIPGGALLRVSFQWDSPFASAGGAGSANNLNIYLVSGNTIWALGNDNNIGGNALEIPRFTNIVATTGTTQFDILITEAAGAVPGVIKYVDFSAPNQMGQGIVYNEHLTNSPTLFGHANAEGALSVGAAPYYNTPDFGVNPPVVENFSALAGDSILFSTAGGASQHRLCDRKRTWSAPTE